jgi:hypothetical protein
LIGTTVGPFVGGTYLFCDHQLLTVPLPCTQL